MFILSSAFKQKENYFTCKPLKDLDHAYIILKQLPGAIVLVWGHNYKILPINRNSKKLKPCPISVAKMHRPSDSMLHHFHCWPSYGILWLWLSNLFGFWVSLRSIFCVELMVYITNFIVPYSLKYLKPWILWE